MGAAERVEMAEEAEQKAEIVRLAYRTFVQSMDKGFDAGESMSLAVEAITPLIKASK